MGQPIYVLVPFGPTSAPGNFTVNHDLAYIPYGIEILTTSPHAVGLQSTWADTFNIFATCSAVGATGYFRVWYTVIGTLGWGEISWGNAPWGS